MKNIIKAIKETPFLMIGTIWTGVTLFICFFIGMFVEIDFYPFIGLIGGGLGFLSGGTVQYLKKKKVQEAENQA